MGKNHSESFKQSRIILNGLKRKEKKNKKKNKNTKMKTEENIIFSEKKNNTKKKSPTNSQVKLSNGDMWNVRQEKMKRKENILLGKKKKNQKMDFTTKEKVMLKAEKKVRRPKKENLKNVIEEELSTINQLTLDAGSDLHSELMENLRGLTRSRMKAIGEEILCVDILNQFPIILNNEGNQDPEAAIRAVRRKIKRFVKFCRRDGYKIIGFIDKGITTKETDDKWESRRIEELNSGRRNCLVSLQTILGTMC